MDTPLKLRRLLAVLEVYQTRTTLKASSKIHMTQPAVTGAVAACEAAIGSGLFERTSKGMTPTAAGQVLCERLKEAFQHLKDAEDFLNQRRPAKAPKVPLHRLVSEVQLRSLSAVIETGGFSQAARRLGVSQPSVHRATRELESVAGLTLYRSEGNGIEPTVEARMLARRGDLCFQEISMGLEEVRELQGVMSGQLVIGALPLARSQWLPSAIAATLVQFPEAKIRVVDGPYDEQLNGLLHGRVDMILGALRHPPPSRDIEQQLCFTAPQVIVVRSKHPLAQDKVCVTRGPSDTQLDGLSWILPQRDTPGRRVFETFLANRGLPSPCAVVECGSVEATRALLFRCDHAALLSAQQVEIEVEQGLLVILGPPLPGSDRPIGITFRNKFRPTGLQRTFIDALNRADGGAVAPFGIEGLG